MNYKNAKELINHFQSYWDKNKKYYVWGTGNTALSILPYIKDEIDIIGFVDNNSEKWNIDFSGYKVYNPETILTQERENQIIVASVAYREIVPLLEARGLKEDIDFCDSRFFVSIGLWNWYRKVHIRRTDISITSYCNLKCKECNMLMPYYMHHKHYDTKDIIEDIDTYFKWVDYVENFNILGGEPFLHPQLYKIVKTTVEQYRKKIGKLELFTNGTIIPKEDVLELMREYRISAYIGDYRQGLESIRPKVDTFVNLLEKHNIKYKLPPVDVWSDFNHTETDRSDWKKEQLVSICRGCNQPFRGIHNKKFYFCHLNTSAILAERFSEEEGDSFDLSETSEELRDELIAFDLVCLPKGYVSYCRYCGGCAPMNKRTVPVAEQLHL